jgi:hypothetical protein
VGVGKAAYRYTSQDRVKKKTADTHPPTQTETDATDLLFVVDADEHVSTSGFDVIAS